jgi:hypothetical protein
MLMRPEDLEFKLPSAKHCSPPVATRFRSGFPSGTMPDIFVETAIYSG